MSLRSSLDSGVMASRAETVKEIFQALEEQGRLKIWLANRINCSLAQLRSYRLGIVSMPSEKITAARVALGLGA